MDCWDVIRRPLHPRPNTRIGERICHPIRHPDLEIISCAEGRERETRALQPSQHAGIYKTWYWQHGDSGLPLPVWPTTY